MSALWQKNRLQLAFSIRKFCDRFQDAYFPLHFCARKLSLQVSQIEENDDIDEFDESYIYEYPTYLVDGNNHHQIQTSINKIMQEVEIDSRFHFRMIPNRLTLTDWTKLLQLDDGKRSAEYRRLYTKEKMRELKEKRAKSSQNRDNDSFGQSFSTNDVVPYKFFQNSIFGFRNLIAFTKKMQNFLLVKKAIFGPHIVIDCSYETHMSLKELGSCARQLAMLRLDNKRSVQPFNIIHCNLAVSGLLFQKLRAMMPDLPDPAFVFHHTEKNYLELFPREKLIYLSPHADVELETYDPDSVYVIGAFVDCLAQDGLSTQKAQLDGIRSVKFPLDKYSNWCRGTRSLMLHQVANILHDIKEGIPWEKTLSENVQITKRTFSGVHWREKVDSTDVLSVKHIRHHVQVREQAYPGVIPSIV